MTTEPSESDQTLSTTAPDGSLTELPFPPVTKAHILNCSYHSWHPT
jgi:hypothetical protein